MPSPPILKVVIFACYSYWYGAREKKEERI